jgi:hypothetical protein
VTFHCTGAIVKIYSCRQAWQRFHSDQPYQIGKKNVLSDRWLWVKARSGGARPGLGDWGHPRTATEGEMKIRGPISEKKLQANRANAKRSTGPKTPAGKATVSRNALKHGVRSGTLSVLPDESTECFHDMLLSVKKNGAPKAIEEEALMEEIAGLWWKLRRLVRREGNSLFRLTDPGSDHLTTLRLLRRYEGSLSRQLGVCIRRLVQLRESTTPGRYRL